MTRAMPDFQNPPKIYLDKLKALISNTQLSEAIEVAKELSERFPNSFVLWNNLGAAYFGLGLFSKATRCFQKATEINPNYAVAYYNLGLVWKAQGNIQKAISSNQNALSVQPDHFGAHYNLGNLFKSLGRFHEAITSYQQAIHIKPKSCKAHNNLGETFKLLGRPQEATTSYRRALQINPRYAECYRNLSMIWEFIKGDALIDDMLKIYRSPSLNHEDRSHICFALAKAFEDIGNFQNAFGFLLQGNAIRKCVLNYNFEQDRCLFRRLRMHSDAIQNASFTPRSISEKSVPVFILGMPRSGTSLVEQIVSNHSDVFGAGELNYVGQFGAELAVGDRLPTEESLSRFRESYLGKIADISEGRAFVTDKMPQNFRFLGLICKALPEAKIIQVMRNPQAVCWSNFKHYFKATGLGYSYDLNDVVGYYKLHEELMEFWARKLPGRIFPLNYEKLTECQEEETRKLIEHIGLDWQSTCLFPHKNKRHLDTASQLQVRQKVYKNSSTKWEKFKPFLVDESGQFWASS